MCVCKFGISKTRVDWFRDKPNSDEWLPRGGQRWKPDMPLKIIAEGVVRIARDSNTVQSRDTHARDRKLT